jgi:hypothetical protein
VRIHTTSRYDLAAQTVTSEREIEFAEPAAGSPTVHRQRFTLRFVYRYEMELLLRAAGFARCQVWGGFDRRPLEKETDEMVWTAWRDGP